MAEMYASRGVGNAGLTTGIIGTALGAVNSGLLNGTGLFGGMGGWNNGYAVCSDNMPINRYEATQSARIAELETEVKLRDANIYTDSKLNDLRNYMERRLDHVEHELCDQRVYNATNVANYNCLASKVNELYGLTALKIPNTSVCPGWGDVTVSVTPATAGA